MNIDKWCYARQEAGITINPELAIQDMTAVYEQLERAGREPFLIYGTLLGAMRGFDFLPHDYDVDFGLLEDSVPDDVIRSLEKRGFLCIRNTLDLTTFHRLQVHVDVYTLKLDDETGCYRNIYNDGRHPQPESVLGELTTHSRLRGKMWRCPAKSGQFLENHYGDWTKEVVW